MNLKKFLILLKQSPESIEFDDTIRLIDSLYRHNEVRFKNGKLVNEPGQNTGSCKILGFARLQNLDKELTLACFGGYYREVLAHPDAADHPNIRQFIEHGWDAVEFDHPPLTPLKFASTTIGFGI